MSKEHSILMTGDSVRAILADLKTQTRRVPTIKNSLLDGGPVVKRIWAGLDWSQALVDPRPSPAGNAGPYWYVPFPAGDGHRIYPRVQPGDVLWVRETCHLEYTLSDKDTPTGAIGIYSADDEVIYEDGHAAEWWCSKTSCPSIHMPRKFCRLLLAVKSVRAGRVQEISGTDCIAEGVDKFIDYDSSGCYTKSNEQLRSSFWALWDSINGTKHPWASNPPNWIYDFKRTA